MKTADIEIQGPGYYSITGITKAGIAWEEAFANIQGREVAA